VQLAKLYENDQLRRAIMTEDAFFGFSEGAPKALTTRAAAMARV
jgi:hypothetical protein